MAEGESAVNPKAILTQKIGGIPFPVLAGVVVVGALGYSMYRKRKAGAAPAADTSAGGNQTDQGQPVFEANKVPAQSTTNAVLAGTGQIATNDDWRRLGIQWLVSNKAMSATDASRVIDDYLAGNPQSVSDGQLRDAVIAVYGLPPTIPSGGSSATPSKAKTQGTPPTIHYVQGSGDTTFLELSMLYYASTAYVQALTDANPNAGEPFNIGTPIQIPSVKPIPVVNPNPTPSPAPTPTPTPTPTPAPAPGKTFGAPVNLHTISATPTSFTVQWDPVPGATRYRVEAVGIGTWETASARKEVPVPLGMRQQRVVVRVWAGDSPTNYGTAFGQYWGRTE